MTRAHKYKFLTDTHTVIAYHYYTTYIPITQTCSVVIYLCKLYTQANTTNWSTHLLFVQVFLGVFQEIAHPQTDPDPS